MEFIKKTILRVMTTGTTTACTGCTGMCRYDISERNQYYIKFGCTKDTIVPDTSVVYNFNISLTQDATDIGFFDAYIAPLLNVLTVTTLNVEGITDETAVIGGIVLADGGKAVTVRGVVWGLDENPTIANHDIPCGSGLGKFITNLSGLTPLITYHVRAYAINSDGLVYGQDVSFKTSDVTKIITAPVTPVTTSTAIGGGNILEDGGVPIHTRGVVWNTMINPTISNNKTINGFGIGTFVSELTGLTTSTLYHVRAYGINAEGVMYGDDKTFTSLGVPIVVTNAVTSITKTTAIGNGEVTSDGGTPVTERGFVWSMSHNPTFLDETIYTGSGTGVFSGSMTGLTEVAQYYVRAFATNSQGTAYGNEVGFITITIPTVITTAASAIEQTTATGGGNITDNGGSSVTIRGTQFGNMSGALTRSTSDGAGSGAFSSSMTSLVANTTFYHRAYATNAAGTAYGTQLEFTTKPIPPPTITVQEIGPTTQTTSVLRANIVNEGSYAVTKRGIAYSTSEYPTILNYFAPNGDGNGMFFTTIGTNTPATNVPLMPGVSYYVRAYFFTNETDYIYSNQIQITALPITVPVLSTTPISSITSYGATSGGFGISDGGGYITAKGLKWGGDGNTTNTILNAGTGTADFSNSLSGLYSNTLYYVRSFATNIAGTGYGNLLSFTSAPVVPTVSTNGISSYTSTTADAGGYVGSDGGATVTSRGFEIGTSTGVYLHTVSVGSGTGAFSTTLTPLTPTTAYYVRAFATNSVGTGYGSEVTFTTNSEPQASITTYDLATETTTTAGVRGDITNDGGHSVTTRGIVWAVSPTAPIFGETGVFNIASGSGTGIFDVTIQPLMPATLYLARAYMFTNEDGYIYGNTRIITTLTATPPTVDATTISNILDTSVMANSSVLSDGLATIISRGFVYSTSQNPTIANNRANVAGTTGIFTTTLTGLVSSTTYYIRAFAINDQGTTYGAQTSFSTAAPSLMYYMLFLYPNGIDTAATVYSDSTHVNPPASISTYDILTDGNQQYAVRYAGPSVGAVAGKTGPIWVSCIGNMYG